MPHIWNYFETRRGTGEHDGVGACIKTALHRKEMKFTTISLIRDENTIVAWCSSVMGKGARRQEDHVGALTLMVLNFGNSMVFLEVCKWSCDSK